jgi:hypothetical protein
MSAYGATADAPGKAPLKRCLLLLGHEPKVEVRHMLVQRKEIDSVGSGDSFDRRDESFHDRTELGTLSRSPVAKIQKMSSGFDDYRPRIGHLKRGVLYKEVLPFDDVAPCGRSFHAVLLPADEAG